jgi:hypothetical protein
MGPAETFKRIAFVIGLVVLLGFIRFFAVLPDRLDPQGSGDGSCAHSAFPAVTSGTGMEISGHLTVCDDLIHDVGATYLYLHKSGESESRQSLIFRFADDPHAGPPAAKWVNASQLVISVESVEQVSKAVPSFDGVSITYVVGREKEGREEWPKQVRRIESTAIVVAALMIALLLLMVWLWFSIRRDRRSRVGYASSTPGGSSPR